MIGFDGLSVGGEVKFDVKHVNDIDDYNVGAEYSQPDYTATIKTYASRCCSLLCHVLMTECDVTQREEG